MDKIVTKSQMQTILDGRPKGVPMDDVLNAYVSNGYKVEGVNYEQPKSTIDKVKDVAIGFGKGIEKTGLDTLQNLQTIGQGAMLATGVPKEMVAKTGFQTLDASSPQGKRVEQAFTPTNADQKLGSNLETGVEILAGGGASLIKDTVVGGAKLLTKTISPIGKTLKTAGEKIYGSAFNPSTKEAEMIQAYEASQPSMFSTLFGAGAIKGNPTFKPITVGETGLRSGIVGTEKSIGNQAKRVADTLWKKEIAPAVDKIEGVITKEELFKPIQERIKSIVDPTKQAAYKNAFASLMDDYKNVKSYTYKQAQALKSDIAEFLPAKIYRGQDVANETRMMQSDMANLIKQKTYESLKDINIKQKYLDYGNLQELQKVGVKAITEGGLKGGFGSFWSTMYDELMAPVKTIGGKVVYKIGDKLQVTATKGFEGKSFGDYLRAVGYLAPQVAEKAITEQQ